MAKLFSLLGKILKVVQPILLSWLSKVAVKAAFKYIFKSVVPGGLQAWIIKYVVKDILFDKAITPLVQKIFRELGYSFEVGKGHILIKRLKEAVDENDEAAYFNTVHDILN